MSAITLSSYTEGRFIRELRDLGMKDSCIQSSLALSRSEDRIGVTGYTSERGCVSYCSTCDRLTFNTGPDCHVYTCKVCGTGLGSKNPISPCILDCDSPSFPPSDDERRQCGCPSCLEELRLRDHSPAGASTATIRVRPLIWTPRYTEPIAPQVWTAAPNNAPLVFTVEEVYRMRFLYWSPFQGYSPYPTSCHATAAEGRAAAQAEWEAFVLAAIDHSTP